MCKIQWWYLAVTIIHVPTYLPLAICAMHTILIPFRQDNGSLGIPLYYLCKLDYIPKPQLSQSKGDNSQIINLTHSSTTHTHTHDTRYHTYLSKSICNIIVLFDTHKHTYATTYQSFQAIKFFSECSNLINVVL